MTMEKTAHFVRCRQSSSDRALWARRAGDRIRVLSCAPWEPFSAETGQELWLNEVSLLAPVEPTKVVALGYNYRDLFVDKETEGRLNHFSEPGFEPVMFLKAPNTIAAPLDRIALPAGLEQVWAEVELAVVIGRKTRNAVSEQQARDAIFGYTIGNDITALNVSGRDFHLARSKSLDGFCPIGPEIVTGMDFESRALRARVNGVETQSANTSNRVFNSVQAVQLVSRLMTLEAGDVILTGTPPGARFHPIRPGDRVEVEIESLGVLRNEFTA
jgi:2-keto-4-pentenoate hydratase/2-oxohepta-3-ene-1,7-dioic acid hydratase in catechol pathway